MESDDRIRRRVGRAQWPVAKFSIGDEPSDDLSESTTATERIAMMWPLAESAWKLAGMGLPTYDRRATPARLFPPGTRPLDDDDT
jgi:hypothetical protein